MTEKKNQEIIEVDEDQNDQREFKCKCKKIYKSYPALYTHIKNKHPHNIDEYKNEAKKPKQGEIEKGRPKKHRDRPVEAEEQGQLLNIIELGILEIEETLRKQQQSAQSHRQGHFEILQGNSKLKQEDLSRQYTKIKNSIVDKVYQSFQQQDQSHQIIQKLKSYKLSDLGNQKPVLIYKQEIYFKNQLIQHFPSHIAAKILIQLQIIEIQIQENQLYKNRYTNNLDDRESIFADDNINEKHYLKVIENLEKQLWKRSIKMKDILRKIDVSWKNKLANVKKSLTNSQNVNTESIISINSVSNLGEEELSHSYHSQEDEEYEEDS